ncbi:serine protease 27-like [Girardinichthys multiradiatus]|uniref:serine protease 27-like n=1 Tax=Girardinichthys multiradiatus TaxID=208333 RepID=UPI001FAD6B15|nr:serine protease 27-like [Girardinichthys multiradiatus]
MALQKMSVYVLMTLLLYSECGRVITKNRIIGGQDADPGMWPWQASLQQFGFPFCGGSLITNEWVLTAAHCISRDDINVTDIHLGVLQLDVSSPDRVNRTLAEIICHPDYDPRTNNNDICLLKLSAPVSFTHYIRPICLASEDSTFHDGLDSWVIGFGMTDNLSTSNTLQEVNVPIVGNNRCACYNQPLHINENMICAGYSDGGKDSCQGDSGRPLMLQNGTVWVQAGVVSFGDGCALPMKPGVYTRVSQYQRWISDIITGMEAGFVTFTSPDTDSDLYFNCATTTPASTTIMTTDDSIFCSGETLSQFTHFMALSILSSCPCWQ